MVARIPALVNLLGALKLDAIGKVPIAERAIQAMDRSNDLSECVLVPPCGLSSAGMLDLANASALEDTVVWFAPLRDAMDRATLVSKFAPSDDTVQWAMRVDLTEHPYALRLRPPNLCTVQGITRIASAPLAASDALSEGQTLPTSVSEACAVIKELAGTVQLSGNFVKRKRSLVWLVDRFLQLQLVAIGMRDVVPKMHQITLEADGMGIAEQAMVAVAFAVATAVRSTTYTWNGAVQLALPGDVDAVRAAMAPAWRVCVAKRDEVERDPLKAVSLAELCHVLACVMG